MNGYIETLIMLVSSVSIVALFYYGAKALIKLTGTDDEQD
jgi:hypothetical protein